ncbi:MAG: hypothetical protein EOO29_36325 [Comamonadaceae bacterium]|nr:MAG: hypothetical protein EOO29_36325 [Comamonadaceae bacterium]
MKHLRQQEARLQLLWCLVVACALGAVLVWRLWAVPIARSVAHAQPAALGESVRIALPPGEVAGVWASGISALLGTIRCTADVGGQPVALRRGPSLDWQDTLWWFTPREGFVQHLRLTGPHDGAVIDLHCRDSLDRYGGEFLIAADSFGTARITRADVPTGSALAVAAVGLPLFAVVLTPILAVQTIRRRRARSAGRRAD